MTFLHTVTILIGLAAVFSYINHRWIRLPLTIGLMATSLVFSLILIAMGKLGMAVEQDAEHFISGIDFNETVLHGFLGFLLFAGSLHVEIEDLFEHKWFIATLASVGVLLSTAIVGLLSFWLFGWMGLDLRLIDCLLFGALISPTDPIAVLGILRKAGVPKALEIRITGESLFNDGVAIVVFLTLFSVSTRGDISWADTIALFFVEAMGGAVLGLVVGYLAYRAMMSINAHQVELLITLALVMGLYGLAEHIHTSAPIAIVVAGLLIGNRGRRWAMSDETREHLDTFWELVDDLLNAVLFVMIGLEVLVLSLKTQYLEAGLIAIPLVLVARLLSVGVPVGLFRAFGKYQGRGTLLLTWGGLRGAISVALALSLPAGEHRDVIIVMTYMIVVFSILIQGLTLGRVVGSAGARPVEVRVPTEQPGGVQLRR